MLGMCGREEMILRLTLWVEALTLGEVVDVVDCQRKVSNIDKDATSHEQRDGHVNSLEGIGAES